MIIIITIYFLSILAMRYMYNLCSSKHYDLWIDDDCKIEFFWFIPVVNTLTAISLFIFILNNKPKQ